MNAIDLFAGCGGLSKGFMDAGFDIIVGVDNDQDALNTFALNHNGAKPLNADLSKQETFDEIKRIAGDRTIDVIIAGPPCQGFSLTGPRNFDDERNKLYLAVIEMVKQYCDTNNVPVSLIQVDTLQKAKDLPCVFNNWGVFYKGNFETVNLLLDVEHLKRILKK